VDGFGDEVVMSAEAFRSAPPITRASLRLYSGPIAIGRLKLGWFCGSLMTPRWREPDSNYRFRVLIAIRKVSGIVILKRYP
jgi:hypothetical protein